MTNYNNKGLKLYSNLYFAFLTEIEARVNEKLIDQHIVPRANLFRFSDSKGMARVLAWTSDTEDARFQALKILDRIKEAMSLEIPTENTLIRDLFRAKQAAVLEETELFVEYVEWLYGSECLETKVA